MAFEEALNDLQRPRENALAMGGEQRLARRRAERRWLAHDY